MSYSGKPGTDDPREVRRRQRPNGRLRPAREDAGVIEHTALNRPLGTPEGNRADKVEIGPWLDQRHVHAGRRRIGYDSLDLSDSKVPA